MSVRTFLLRALAASSLFAAAPLSAGHTPIVVDGDLADLIAAVNANLGAERGGFVCDDTQSEFGTQQCPYFVNGFDIDKIYFYYDHLSDSGVSTGDIILYVGFDMVGVIGDVDGNGNPDTFDPNHSCGAGDNPGISNFESYAIDVDLNCDGVPNVRLGVKNNQVIDHFTNQTIPGAAFAIGASADTGATNGRDKLEVAIPLKSVLPAGTDVCNLTIRGQAGAEFDFLGQDNCGPPSRLAIPPRVELTASPAEVVAEPGDTVVWNVDLSNTGLCAHDAVRAALELPEGLRYLSDDAGSTGDDRRRAWSLGGLERGAARTIEVRAVVDAPCTGQSWQAIFTAEAEHDSPCLPEVAVARASTQTAVRCAEGPAIAACPRGPGFWKQQCAQKGNGSTKFTLEEVRAIAECIDDRVASFDWSGDPLADLCEALDPARPMSPAKQARRHFATLLANVCAGRLGLVAGDGTRVVVDERAAVDCEGADARTVGELIDELDVLIGSAASDNDPIHSRVLACLEELDGELELAGNCGGSDPADAPSIQWAAPHPNPFRTLSNLVYRVLAADGARVEVAVYDLEGRLVRRLDAGWRAAGEHRLEWSGLDSRGKRAPSGIYFVRARDQDAATVHTVRLVLLP